MLCYYDHSMELVALSHTMGQKGQVWQPQATFILFCILSAGPCKYNINKFRGKSNTPVGLHFISWSLQV